MKLMLGILAMVTAGEMRAGELAECDSAKAIVVSPNTIEFDATNGNITATAASGVQCAPASVDLTGPSGNVPLVSVFTMQWTSTGLNPGMPCTPTGGVGTTWPSGPPLAATGSRQLVSPATGGVINFGITCNSPQGPVSDTTMVTFGNGGGGGASVTLDGPASAGLGEPVTLTWTSTGTVGANPCTPQGALQTGWAALGPLPANGSRTITGPPTEGPVNFVLTCNTASGTVSDSHSINFTLQPPDCSSVTFPPNVFSFRSESWDALYGGPFPLVYSANRAFNIFPGQGLKMSFTPQIPGSATPNGSLTYNEHNGSTRIGYMSISRCANDFRAEVLNTATSRCLWGPAGQLSLSFRLTNHAPNFCNLIPNVPYFINIHFGGTEVGPDGAVCNPGPCAIIGGTQGIFLSEPEQ